MWRLIAQLRKDNPLLTNLASLATVVGVAAIAITLADWANRPSVGLRFYGGIGAFVRPGAKPSDDLSAIGFKETNPKILGLPHYSNLTGILGNLGNKDAEQVEVKFPVDATLKFGKFTGDDPTNVPPESESYRHIEPNQYVSLGDLRADESFELGVCYSAASPISQIVFRYKDGGATQTLRYAVTLDERTGLSRINEVTILGPKGRLIWGAAYSVIAIVFLASLYSAWASWRARREAQGQIDAKPNDVTPNAGKKSKAPKRRQS